MIDIVMYSYIQQAEHVANATQAMSSDVHFWDSTNVMTAALGLLFSGTTVEKQWTVAHLKGPCHFVA